MISVAGGAFVEAVALAVAATFCVPVPAEFFLGVCRAGCIRCERCVGTGDVCREELGVCMYPRKRVEGRLMLAKVCDDVENNAFPWETLCGPSGKFADIKEHGGSDS